MDVTETNTKEIRHQVGRIMLRARITDGKLVLLEIRERDELNSNSFTAGTISGDQFSAFIRAVNEIDAGLAEYIDE